MATVRIYSPAAKTITHPSGRGYVAASASVTDVQEGEIEEMDWQSQGVIVLGAPGINAARSGTTAQRPTYSSPRPPRLGEPYIDTSLATTVFFIGPLNSPSGKWVNISGSTV